MHSRFLVCLWFFQDEVVAANSVAFSMDGSKIFCGFNKAVKVFDTNRPGCECMEYATAGKIFLFSSCSCTTIFTAFTQD